MHAQVLRPTMTSFISKNLAGPAFRLVSLHSNDFALMRMLTESQMWEYMNIMAKCV